MKSSTLFWGIVLILLGGVLLMSNLGLFTADVWGILWPCLVILLGVWLLLGALNRKALDVEHAIVALEGAQRARLRLQHGAGRLRLYAGASGDNLVEGDFGGGLNVQTRRQGDLLEVDMRVPARAWSAPTFWSTGGLNWSFGLNPATSLILDLETGAGKSHVDLSDLQVGELILKTGASSTTLDMPAKAGYTRAEISSGAASVRVNVPPGVAARIRYSGSLASISLDKQRFPLSGGVYQSPDYDSADNKVDLNIEFGVGSVDVR